MLDNIILGTANFTQPYGILSGGNTLQKKQVLSILENACENKIGILDTALGYGNILSVLTKSYTEKFNIITKFSVLDNPDVILEKIKMYDTSRIYGVMVHDPQNLPLVCKNSLSDLFQSFRQNYGIKRIGVSVYDMQDIENFLKISIPDIIQIPLNPFNQAFDDKDFKTYAKENDIEIHARSLFLQGVLLEETLPRSLNTLDPIWLKFREVVKLFPSCLYALLRWALQKEWVDKWVIGVASAEHLKQIENAIDNFDNKKVPCFDIFKNIQNPMIDPRNWKTQ